MKKRAQKKSKGGFALALTLVLSLVLIILSIAITYVTQSGFIGIAVHQKNKIVENEAEWGISQAIAGLEAGNVTCNQTLNLTSPNGGTVEVKLVQGGDTCFIWSKATYKSTKLVKVATVTITSAADYAPLIAKNFYFSSGMCCMKGYIVVESCDPSCPTPAAILGNSLSYPFSEKLYACGEGNYGFISNATPVVKENADLSNIYSMFFNPSKVYNLDSLLNTLSLEYKVVFSTGDPIGVTGNKTWNPSDFGLTVTDCNANIDTNNKSIITCSAEDSIGNTLTIKFTESANGNGSFVYDQNGEYYDAINLGNVSLKIYQLKNAKISAKDVYLVGSSNKTIQNSTVVATDYIKITHNGTILNSQIFSSKMDFQYGSKIEGSLLYTGGSEGSINCSKSSTLGNETDPVLIIFNSNIATFGNRKG